jgi:hypothetical protein
MDEMTLLKDLGHDLGVAGEGLKPATRQHVLASISKEGRAREPWFGAGGAARSQRPVRRLAVPLGAALLVGGLGVTALIQSQGSPQIQPLLRPGTAITPTDTALSAKQILLAAAVTARADKSPPPSAKSFIYTRTKELDGASRVSTREAWLSVDGTRDSVYTPSFSNDLVLSPGCVNGLPKVENGVNGWLPCSPDPAYRADYPTTVAEARESLYHYNGSTGRITDDSAFENAGSLLIEGRMTAASRAALFEAITTIPGVELVPNAVTASGAIGVAVAKVSAERGWRAEIIFDPVQHTVIGRRTVELMRLGKPSAPYVSYSAGVVETGVVKRVLLRPDGTVRSGPIQTLMGGAP